MGLFHILSLVSSRTFGIRSSFLISFALSRVALSLLFHVLKGKWLSLLAFTLSRLKSVASLSYHVSQVASIASPEHSAPELHSISVGPAARGGV